MKKTVKKMVCINKADKESEKIYQIKDVEVEKE